MTASTLSTYREGWGEWLTSVFEGQSTTLLTLTFAPRLWERDDLGPTGPTRSRVERAGLRLEKRLIMALAKPSFFIVREIGGWNGRAHLHCLLSSADRVLTREARAMHELEGFTNERTCAMAPAEYVTKYVTKSDGDWWRAGGPLFLRGVEEDRLAALGAGDVRLARARGSGEVRLDLQVSDG